MNRKEKKERGIEAYGDWVRRFGKECWAKE